MDMMVLTCPHCGLSREIPEAQTTASAPVNVLCPGCQEIFVFDPANVSSAPDQEPPEADFVFAPISVAEADLPKAGFWIRAAAAFVDALISGVLQGIVVFLFAGLMGLLLHGYDSESLIMVCLPWGIPLKGTEKSSPLTVPGNEFPSPTRAKTLTTAGFGKQPNLPVNSTSLLLRSWPSPGAIMFIQGQWTTFTPIVCVP